MANSLIRSTIKTLKEHKEELSYTENAGIEAALSDLERSIKGDIKELIIDGRSSIYAKVDYLNKKLQVIAQKAQEKASAEGSETADGKADEDVVDADFEEVEEEK